MNPGELIREERLAQGMTLNDLQKASGVNYSRISRIERGDGASEDAWQALADALDLEYTPAVLRKKKRGKR